jgi:hypothetical protein
MTTDPRKLGGGIAGPGGPYDRGGVVIDTRNAVLLDGSQVALIDAVRGETHEPSFAVELQGRVNKTTDRVTVLYLTGADGIAALVSELLAVASRAGNDLTTDVLARLEQRLREVPH